jgi:YjbE family integral membrane protein
VRIVLAFIIVWLLAIPWLRTVGATLLVWIAYRLVAEAKGKAPQSLVGKATFWGAMQTIIVADATMGLDNVLGVAGAAEGNMFLLAGGMLLSIPIVVWGSTLLLRLLQRFPALIYIGCAVLAWTAGGMFVEEPAIGAVLGQREGTRLAIELGLIAAVLGAGWLRNRYPSLAIKARQR